MTQQQMYEACVEIAPDFRIGVEFPVLGRTMVWRGTPRGSMAQLSAGKQYTAISDVDALLSFLLNQALVTLRAAV